MLELHLPGAAEQGGAPFWSAPATVNEVMAEYFSQPYPARAAVQVAALPKGVDVEADAILSLP